MMANFTTRPEDSDRDRELRGGGKAGASADRRDPLHDPAHGS
jgi:hypothetical protein